MIVLLGACLAAALLVPHLVPRTSLTPINGITVWLSVLGLRVLLSVFAAAIVVALVPATQLFQLVTHWCFHAVVPFFATHLGFSGHRLGDAAALVPSVVLALSVVSASFAIWRGIRAVRRWMSASAVGAGPRRSVIVGGQDVVVAAAGIRDARIVVSAGALVALDEAELTAGLEHEQGHIERHHPYLALAGSLLHAIARVLPGSRLALRELHFHLERDADEYAVTRTGDPLALASVICKAAHADWRPSPAFSGLGGAAVAPRLKLLLDRSAARPGPMSRFAGRAFATALATLVLALSALGPAVAWATAGELAGGGNQGATCRH